MHIPILPDRLANTPCYEAMPVVGVHGGNALARNGGRINKSYTNKGYAAALNLDPRTKGVLEFYVKDRTLEGLWDKRKDIYPVMKEMAFTKVISPNFSVYEDAPRVDHLYNIKRTTMVYNEMLDSGITAVPDVSWFNRDDLDRWCDEINKNNVKCISFSFQVVDVSLKPSNIWRNYLLGFRYLCRNIKKDVRVIVAGLVSPFRIYEVYKASDGQRIHILNQSAYVQSRRGMASDTRRQDRDLPFDSLLGRNISYFNRIYAEMDEAAQGRDGGDSIVGQALTWDRAEIVEFYKMYNSDRDKLYEKYGDLRSDEDRAGLVYSVVNRQIQKKRIKI